MTEHKEPAPASISRSLPREDRELALRLAFNVLSISGSISLTSLRTFLHPWGWTDRDLRNLLDELSADNVVETHLTPSRIRTPNTVIAITDVGRSLTDGDKFLDYRAEITREAPSR